MPTRDRRAYAAAYYEANRDQVREREKARAKARRVRISDIKLKAGCVDCGYRKHAAALEFDHLPGTTKSFNIGAASRRPWALIEEEMAKCEVVCANCHRVRTTERLADGR